MKKFFSAIISLCLIFSVFSFNVITVNAVMTDGYYEYSISNGEAIITKYKGEEKNVIIPSIINNYSVTSIKERAFYQNFDIESVIIPSSVKSIGKYAFFNCGNLKKVTINNGLETIGEYAFDSCRELELIVIPQSLSLIKSHAFSSCHIEEVYITDLKSWCEIYIADAYASPFHFNHNDYSTTPAGYIKTSKLYLNNKLITELIIPEGVTRICTDAFHGCNSITKVVIPDSVIRIDEEAFRDCTAIKDVWYTGSERESENIIISQSGGYAASTNANAYLTEATWHYNSCPIGAPHAYDNDCDDSCNGCGKIRTVEGHKYSDWEITKKESCVEDGTKTRKCSICSNVETSEISALGHNFSNEWTIDKKATCTTAGSKSHHCTRCSETKDNTTIQAKGHDFGEWIVEKEATYKTEGLSVRKCGECNLRETQTIAKLSTDGHTHDFGEWQIKKVATCEEKGSAIRECSICNEKEQKELLATGHQVGEWVETPATCTNDGFRERTCVVCEETEKIVLKALGHDFENPVITKEPTENENGLKQGKCKRCGEETTEEIPALGTVTNENTNNGDGYKNSDNNNGDNGAIIWILVGVIVALIVAVLIVLLIKKKKSKV